MMDKDFMDSIKEFSSDLEHLPMVYFIIDELGNNNPIENNNITDIARIISKKYGNSTYNYLVKVKKLLLKEKLIISIENNNKRRLSLVLTDKGKELYPSIHNLIGVLYKEKNKKVSRNVKK